MNPAALLTGSLGLHPGQQPALTRHGPTGLATRVARGQTASALPGLMASLHALCASGHRLAARLALRAAQGEPCRPDAGERQALRQAVQREQMRAIAHDWPRLLPPGDEAQHPLPLSGAPFGQTGLSATEQQARLRAWLQQHWLGCPPATLLAALTDDPPRSAAAALRWARREHTPLARLLAHALPAALALPTAQRPLCLPAPDTALALPTTRVPDTGPWCRLHDPQPLPSHSAGQRLIARLADLLRLVATDGDDWLHATGQALAPGRGRAWVEVGRGLLGYELQIDTGADGPRVQALQLLSPTCWNTHPAGVLAEALATLPRAATPDGLAGPATCLALAFDPCLPFAVTTVAQSAPETSHA
ncbi:hypothetical protein [Pseudorhodoferax sp.]|uniref:hypothetical protein n=1 Tax=Pseudorhodoferax sp. TaxID=1993553 RepID=UPI002DD666BC|nr:hypothetical protein [Pseudorhodoferax sp.]